MRLKEAAYIIGILGGRPKKIPDHWYRDGYYGGGNTGDTGTPANGYVLEDGITFYVAENGTTFYVQEN